MVKILLANENIMIDAVTSELRSSLHCALQNGHLDVVNALIEAKCNVLL